MSVKIIAQLHPFSSEKTEFRTSPDTVKNLVKLLGSAYDPSYTRILFDDEIITDFERIPNDEQIVYIKIVPQGDGSLSDQGGKMAGWGAVAIGLGIAACFLLAAPLIGVAIIGTGVSMLVGGGVLANYKIPSVSTRASPDQTPSIKGSRNTEKSYGYIPFIFGKHLIYPDIAAHTYTLVEGDDNYLLQLFCAGYNDIEIDTGTFKIGDTLLEEYSESKNISTILAGNDSIIKMEILLAGEKSLLYQKVCREQALSQILKNKYDDGTDGSIIRTTPDGTTEINVDIFFYNGLGKYNSDGYVVSATAIVTAYYKLESDPDSKYALLGYFTNYDQPVGYYIKEWVPRTGMPGQETGGYWKDVFVQTIPAGPSNVMSASELKTKRYQITKTGLPAGVYTIKFTRETADSTNSNIVDAVYVGSIRAFTEDEPVRPGRARDLAIIVLKIKATDRINGEIDSFNFVAQSKIPSYPGLGGGSGSSSWLTAPTRNPAAMFKYALQGKINADQVSDKDIDWVALEEWSIWCDEHNYTCNVVLSEKKTLSDLLTAITGTARAEWVKIDSKISVIQDKKKSTPIQMFTPRNSKSYQQTIGFSDIPDALEMSFIDESSGYQDNERTVYNTDTGIEGDVEPDTKQTVELWGITNSTQAFLIGRYDYACMLLRPRIHTLEVDLEYLMCTKGDWIQYAGDIALIGTARGRIKDLIIESSYIVGLYLDERIVFEQGTLYGIRIRKSNGQIILQNVESDSGSKNYVTFLEPILQDNGPAENDIFSFGIRGNETIDLIVTAIDPTDDWNATLTCVDYRPEIFNVDDPDYTIPPFESKITTGGVVDNGYTNPRDWNAFTTYHDSKDQPAIPTGDGTENGWHRAITLESKWISTKIAPTASVGPWGIPTKTTALVIDETDDKLSTRPTYTEIVNGFTQAGVVIIPSQLDVSAVGGFRFITLNWSKQQNLSNLREYQTQCSEDAITWYAPTLDGSGINGHGFVVDNFYSTTAPMLVHPNIPPSGTDDAPAGRLLYYRVRQRTMLEALSDWSTVVAATTKLADTGDYAANSISLNALKTNELYALFATLGETLIIDPNAGLSAQTTDYVDGDSRTVLNAKELLFQYVSSGSWVTIVRLALEGLMANQVYSKDKLFITNDDMAGRRARGFDVGLAYLSASSKVIHYDSDMLDQTGAAYFTMTGSGALVGKDDGITPAIVAVAPYATEAKSLYGNFRLQKTLGIINTFSLDFWIRYYYNENQELFRIGSASEYISIDILNSEPYYNDDSSFQYNNVASASVWYNEVQGAVARVVYCLNGVFDVRYIQDASGNPGLTTGNWYHIGVIDSGTVLVVLINSTRFQFTSPGVRTESVSVDINNSLGQFLVDEVMIDTTIAESETAFLANTIAKKPWAKLSDASDWFVLDVKDPAFLKTNIWESQGFKDAVLAIAAAK